MYYFSDSAMHFSVGFPKMKCILKKKPPSVENLTAERFCLLNF